MKRTIICLCIMVQIMFFPAFALADHDAVHKCPPASGTTRPTGSAAATFTFNSTSCLWENAHFTWDPVTKVTTALDSLEFKLNPSTGNMERTIWVYSPAAGAYTPRVEVQPKPISPTPAPSGTIKPAQQQMSGSAAANNQPSSSTSISNTGPDSNNTIDNSQTTNGNLNLGSNVSVTNGINSIAGSGNALVQGNTTGGNAATGDAETIVNILNLLQSSWNPSNGDITTFSADIYDHYGDLLFDPSIVLSTGSNSNNQINRNSETNLDINIQNDGRIVNNVDLSARTGDASVTGNTTGGNATTGDANAVANIFNLVNAMIAPGSSFIGTINILGSLNGDILLPSLLASIGQTGPDSTNAINSNNTTNANVTSFDNRSIANSTNLSASSGNAAVTGNTTGGSATTGDAQTELNIFNLTGRDIIGSNGLLVFSNVLGSWSGFIFDAPTGQSSVLGTGPGSTNTVNSNTTNNLSLDSVSNTAIENNITASARSGDATVANNTTGGNAATGNATASANIVNLINSQLNFSDWFGVLFINVFGDWTGSFGRDTEAGNTRSNSAGNSSDSGNTSVKSKAPGDAGPVPRRSAQIFGFVASSSASGGSGSASNSTHATVNSAVNQSNDITTASDAVAKKAVSSVATVNKSAQNSAADSGYKLSLTTIGIMIGLSLLVIERWSSVRGNKKKQAA
jgi:hypothetical protein